MLDQLDLFSLEEVPESNEKEAAPTANASANNLFEPPFEIMKQQTTEDQIHKDVSSDEFDEITEVTEISPFNIGTSVFIDFTTEESDFELYNYLHYYYPHLKGKKGEILKVMPYKKLQYLIEFDVKSEDNQLILDHENVIWVAD